MIRVTVELVPLGIESQKRHLSTMVIANDATGTPDMGNYTYRLSKWGDPDSVWRRGEIKEFPRVSRGAWDLIYRVLQEAVGKRNDKG